MTDMTEGNLATSIDELRQELAKDSTIKIEVVERKEANSWALVCHGELIGAIEMRGKGTKAEQICAEILHATVRSSFRSRPLED